MQTEALKNLEHGNHRWFLLLDILLPLSQLSRMFLNLVVFIDHLEKSVSSSDGKNKSSADGSVGGGSWEVGVEDRGSLGGWWRRLGGRPRGIRCMSLCSFRVSPFDLRGFCMAEGFVNPSPAIFGLLMASGPAMLALAMQRTARTVVWETTGGKVCQRDLHPCSARRVGGFCCINDIMLVWIGYSLNRI